MYMGWESIVWCVTLMILGEEFAVVCFCYGRLWCLLIFAVVLLLLGIVLVGACEITVAFIGAGELMQCYMCVVIEKCSLVFEYLR